MPQFSFDVVSNYDLAEVTNVLQQTKRELLNRYDFKNTSADIDWLDNDKSGFKITGDSQYQLDAIVDIVRKTLAKRNQSQKLLDTSTEPSTTNLKMSWTITFKKGLDQDKAKKITSLIRNEIPKLKTQIQGDEIRVTGSSKDELQTAMDLIRAKNFDFPLQFTNYR